MKLVPKYQNNNKTKYASAAKDANTGESYDIYLQDGNTYDSQGNPVSIIWTPDTIITPNTYNQQLASKSYGTKEKELETIYPEFDLIAGLKGFNFNPTKIGTNIVKSAKNKIGFVERPNTFTRGIGNHEGVKDLVESKVVRGNPIGTEMSAKSFTKATKHNRNRFNDIMNDTGRKDIAHRYYNRSLTEEDFNAINNSYNKINESIKSNTPKEEIRLRFALEDNGLYHPLGNYKDYKDYVSKIASDRKTLRNATTINPDNGEPIAYFYNDGRNPLTQGHSYAASKWGVRINNPQDYNMKIFNGHLHYSNSKTIPFDSPNVEVFRSTPFGTIRYPKWMLRRGWYRNGGKLIADKDRVSFTDCKGKKLSDLTQGSSQGVVKGLYRDQYNQLLKEAPIGMSLPFLNNSQK